MVIKGNSRGNGRQLARHLLAPGDNEAIRILDIDNQLHPDDEELHNALLDMSASVELSKGSKGLYHAVINPDTAASHLMTDNDWLFAADILGRELGLEQQRRAIVLHTKKGRIHAHVVWERYDLEQKKLVSDSFSRLAQDRARKEMEAVFNHKPTPHRNKHRPELKAALTRLWQQTATGPEFITAATAQGYLIATGSGRSAFMVVDSTGRSFDLTRQLQGVRVKEVRQRLSNETLLGEKQAIEQVRRNAAMTDFTADKEQITAINPDAPVYVMQRFRSNTAHLTAKDKSLDVGAIAPIQHRCDGTIHHSSIYRAMNIL
jgi:hypothetical protein